MNRDDLIRELHAEITRLRSQVSEMSANETRLSLSVENLCMVSKVFDYALEGIVITNLNGIIVKVNPAFTQITGYTEAEAVGKDPSLLKSGMHGPEFFTELWTKIRNEGKWQGEIWNRRKNGEIFVEGATISAIKNESGATVNYASVFTDITARKEAEQKLLNDLQLAKQVQKSVISPSLHKKQIAIDAAYIPSETLGGDMYAWYEIDEHRYGILLLDVMGHGVAASLISMSIRSLLQGMITSLTDPAEVATELNKHMRNLFYQNEDREEELPLYFFTSIYLVIDTDNKTIEYMNTGHPPGLLLQSGQDIELLDRGGVPIGVLPEIQAEKAIVHYSGTTKMILYTDGLIESGGQAPSIGLSKLKVSFDKYKELDNKKFIERILDEHTVKNQADDICIIAITIFD